MCRHFDYIYSLLLNCNKHNNSESINPDENVSFETKLRTRDQFNGNLQNFAKREMLNVP